MIAFDTNILVYAQEADQGDPRHKTAIDLILRAALVDACIPVQTLGELLNVCIRKLGMLPDDAIHQVEDYTQLFHCPQMSLEDLLNAARLANGHKLQFFDALIITVAARAGATVLLSEDMQNGLEIEGLRIINPFLAVNETLLADVFDSAF